MFLKSDLERPEVDFDRFLDNFGAHFGAFWDTKAIKKSIENLSKKKSEKELQKVTLGTCESKNGKRDKRGTRRSMIQERG